VHEGGFDYIKASRTFVKKFAGNWGEGALSGTGSQDRTTQKKIPTGTKRGQKGGDGSAAYAAIRFKEKPEWVGGRISILWESKGVQSSFTSNWEG